MVKNRRIDREEQVKRERDRKIVRRVKRGSIFIYF